MKSGGTDNSLEGARILFVFGNLELGGAERQGLLLGRYLKEKYGADVRVLGLQEGNGRLSELCDEADIPWEGTGVSWRWERRHIPANLLELRRFAALLKRQKPDLLMPYTFFPNVICGLAWRLTGAKLCVWNQRDEGFCLEPELWRSLAARLTPCFISNSDKGREALLSAFPVSPGKVAVITNGILPARPLSGRGEWRGRIGLSEEAFAACMVANVHAQKDHETLLRAWRILADRQPQGAPAPVLLLAGRVDQGDQVRTLVDSLGLADTVRFLGEVGDVAGLLSAVDLCVHSSRSEGLPNAVLEAMACGLAVVATDIPGIREAVGPQGLRFLAPAGDASALAGRIAQLQQDPPLRATTGAEMRARVTERFDAEGAWRETVSFIGSRWP
ncbi:glycosyltransferase [Geomonas subterranea]|uniref:glycosyltransferase n=1 Tax=Geomonas subterranea TaxID=2847989 RepID=UPI001CD2FB46|nr:glycosyltransferase [Geomonas fuzhouensis]